MEWYAYALAAMLLFGLANLALKELLKTGLVHTLSAHQTELLKAAAALAVFLLALYFVFLRALPWPAKSGMLLLAFAALSGLAFACLVLALQSGKVAPVTAIASASTVVVAVLSVAVFKDSLSIKEWAGVAVTFVGVLLLVR